MSQPNEPDRTEEAGRVDLPEQVEPVGEAETAAIETGPGYAEAYSDERFWTKVKGALTAAGREVIHKALLLYYAYQHEDTPRWAKITIATALGYFIVPTDAIADLIPLVGYADDLGALVAALATVAAHVDDGVRAKADEKVERWFGADEPDGAVDVVETDAAPTPLTGD